MMWITNLEKLREAVRELAAHALAIALVIPAGVIWAVDRLTSIWIRRRGGLN